MIIKWTFEKLRTEALKYKTKGEFAKNNQSAYLAATRHVEYSDIVEHMPKRKDIKAEQNPHFKWTNESLEIEAKKYFTRGDFQKGSPSAYTTARKRKIIEDICKHMSVVRKHHSEIGISEEAKKYNKRSEFAQLNSPTYQAAKRNGYLDKVCSHMKISSNTSPQEDLLMREIKGFYPKAQKFKDNKISIPDKSHIKGFEIDIYIPELRKGIEFDGTWHHSTGGLKRGRPNWPDSDIEFYHQLKDSHFASKGIQILHIKEEDWNNNKLECILQIESFLGISNFMKECE